GGKRITDLVFMSIEDLQRFFVELELDEHDQSIAQRILVEITNRLQYLLDVGLGYLNLDRQSSTLSGGESQRINLATSLGSALVGSLYILDEPSIGLHPRDNQRLIKVLKQLRDLGNTVIVVEHDSEIMRQADVLVDIGPRAGRYGGEVVYNGAPSDIASATDRSLTAQYLCGEQQMPSKEFVRRSNRYIEIKSARENNLKNVDVRIPLGVMTAVTGVSGSGKSSLIGEILYPALRRELADVGTSPGDFDSLEGDIRQLHSVELINQNPIGKSARSNPVTYVKAYDDIRKIFTEQRSAQIQGLEPSAFSFNIAGGRCEECLGEGVIRVQMQFMADVELVCEECAGKRFKQKILDVTYKGKNIHEVLEMSIDQAIEFFEDPKDRLSTKVVDKLRVLQSVGLGYIKLGQSSSTLSGGENQRVKLASFLLKENSTKPILFIFDEPTTGLHFHDIKKLLKAMEALVERGHTVVAIEHNMNVVRMCDWVIDLGLEGGDKGGRVLFEGRPKELCKLSEKESYTAKYLKESYELGI
ncbi:MAG: excinuclease ABC subunit UvrA, partial [Rikenellaceae bacterium]